MADLWLLPRACLSSSTSYQWFWYCCRAKTDIQPMRKSGVTLLVTWRVSNLHLKRFRREKGNFYERMGPSSLAFYDNVNVLSDATLCVLETGVHAKWLSQAIWIMSVPQPFNIRGPTAGTHSSNWSLVHSDLKLPISSRELPMPPRQRQSKPNLVRPSFIPHAFSGPLIAFLDRDPKSSTRGPP